MLRRNAGVRPAGDLIGALHGDERDPHAIGVVERQHALAEARLGRIVGDALRGQPLPPVAERAERNDESGFDGHAVAVATGW